MLIELQRFVEFGPDWYPKHEIIKGAWEKTKNGDYARSNMVFEPITINTEYVSTVRRKTIWPCFEFCEVWMVDIGQNFIIDKTYEEMRDILKGEKK